MATAEPATPARDATREDRGDLVLFDGDCGLCHRTVLFAIARDRDGSRFRFAPLAGETAARAIAPDVRARLPDSLVVLTRDGRMLVRSRAALRILARSGSTWRVLAALGRVVPRALADLAYDAIARRRHRWFARPASACPIVPPSLRDRFLP